MKKTQWPLIGAVCFFLVVVFSVLGPASGASSPERGGMSKRLAIPTVFKVNVSILGDATRVIIDLSGKADFSYKTDRAGTLISVGLADVAWQAAQSSLNGMGLVLGYYFNKDKNGVGRLDIATAVPVVVKSAFASSAKIAHGYKIIFDLQASRNRHIAPFFKAIADFSPHPRKPAPPILSYRNVAAALVSGDKVALVRQGKRFVPSDKRTDKSPKPYEYASFDDADNLPFDKNKISSPVEIGGATDGCPPFPRIPWWKNNTHKNVVRYVDAEYYGDWGAYISKWESHLTNVVGVVAERKKMLIKRAGVIISGEGFIDYLQKIKQRISIIRCLSHKGTI